MLLRSTEIKPLFYDLYLPHAGNTFPLKNVYYTKSLICLENFFVSPPFLPPRGENDPHIDSCLSSPYLCLRRPRREGSGSFTTPRDGAFASLKRTTLNRLPRLERPPGIRSGGGRGRRVVPIRGTTLNRLSDMSDSAGPLP